MKRTSWIAILGVGMAFASVLMIGAVHAQEKQISPVSGHGPREGEAPERASPGLEGATRAPKLDALIVELLTYNPEILSVMEEVNAARHRVPIEKSLDDPRLSVEAMDIPTRNTNLDQTPMDGIQFYLMQAVPFPGKRKLKKELASLHVEEMHQAYLETINTIVAEFKLTVSDYGYTTEAIAIHERTKSQFLAAKSILESRYAASGGSAMSNSMSSAQVSQGDILKIKLEASTIEKELISLRNNQKRHEAKLRALLNRPLGAPLTLKPLPARMSPLPELSHILDLAQSHRPSLQRAKIHVEESELEQRLAKKSFLPDFDFKAGYRARSFNGFDPNTPEHFVSAGIELNLPVWAARKQKQAVALALSEKKSREHMRAAAVREVLADVESLYYELQEMKSQIDLYRSRILPESEASLASSRRNYQIAAADYRDVMMGQNTVLENQLMFAALRYGYEKKIAELDMQIGVPLSLINP